MSDAAATQETRAAWQRAIDTSRKRGWYSLATALTEGGPHEGVNYDAIVKGEDPETILPSIY